ncbi:AGE family epimerase/isomerase [Boudabousia liubingyangii]|nr:AGE family epimerase/isomerase [Boudabousia liubingyangii]
MSTEEAKATEGLKLGERTAGVTVCPQSPEWLNEEFKALLDFGMKSQAPLGFGYLGRDGQLIESEGMQLWINCRMTHIACVAYMRGYQEALPMAEHGLKALLGVFHDEEFGGWYSRVELDGKPSNPAASKEAYAHAFVCLAASSLVQAKIPGAQELLDLAIASQLEHWWDPQAGMVVNEISSDFSEVDAYRGINAAMHSVEAYQALADVTGDESWADRALLMIDFTVDQAKAHGWRIPEHYNSLWEPDLDYNLDRPADPFRPYGATPGHGFEWARLVLQLALRRGRSDLYAPALELFKRALADGWAADGKPGFVYATDFEGEVSVAARMHWVLVEAISAANALAQLGVEAEGLDLVALQAQWWAYAEQVLIDSPGRWNHEVNGDGEVVTETWPGMPDIYHAAQATYFPFAELPLSFSGSAAQQRG